jgi:hypothetical protein
MLSSHQTSLLCVITRHHFIDIPHRSLSLIIRPSYVYHTSIIPCSFVYHSLITSSIRRGSLVSSFAITFLGHPPWMLPCSLTYLPHHTPSQTPFPPCVLLTHSYGLVVQIITSHWLLCYVPLSCVLVISHLVVYRCCIVLDSLWM